MDIPGQLDMSRIDELRKLGQEIGEDLLGDLLKMYLENTPQIIARIKEGIQANDAKKVELNAHTLKSSSANIGAKSLSLLAAQIELSAKGQIINDLGPQMEMVDTEAKAIIAEVSKLKTT
jgi:HPt (histidine-containing phosphotransfer) domain-containing protein